MPSSLYLGYHIKDSYSRVSNNRRSKDDAAVFLSECSECNSKGHDALCPLKRKFQEGEKSGRQDRPGIPSPGKNSHSHSLAAQMLRDPGGATWAVPLAAPKPAGNRAAGPGRPFRDLPGLRARPGL